MSQPEQDGAVGNSGGGPPEKTTDANTSQNCSTRQYPENVPNGASILPPPSAATCSPAAVCDTDSNLKQDACGTQSKKENADTERPLPAVDSKESETNGVTKDSSSTADNLGKGSSQQPFETTTTDDASAGAPQAARPGLKPGLKFTDANFRAPQGLYKILGVSPQASKREIRKAYFHLAIRLHPDKNPENSKECEESFKIVGRAYQILSDDAKKAQYDNSGCRVGDTDDCADIKADMKEFFRRQFGGNQFYDIIGELIAVSLYEGIAEMKVDIDQENPVLDKEEGFEQQNEKNEKSENKPKQSGHATTSTSRNTSANTVVFQQWPENDSTGNKPAPKTSISQTAGLPTDPSHAAQQDRGCAQLTVAPVSTDVTIPSTSSALTTTFASADGEGGSGGVSRLVKELQEKWAQRGSELSQKLEYKLEPLVVLLNSSEDIKRATIATTRKPSTLDSATLKIRKFFSPQSRSSMSGPSTTAQENGSGDVSLTATDGSTDDVSFVGGDSAEANNCSAMAIEMFKEKIRAEVAGLQGEFNGARVLKSVGRVYELRARKYLGGLGGFWSSLVETKNTSATILRFAVKAIHAKGAFKKIATHMEGSAAIADVPESGIPTEAINTLLDALWFACSTDIERMIQFVCDEYLDVKKKHNLAPDIAKKRAVALLLLGQLYKEATEPPEDATQS